MHNIQPSAAAAKLGLLTTLQDRTSTLIAYWDADLRCRYANRAYEHWFGVSPEALIGEHISTLLGPSYKELRQYIEAVLRGEPQEFERDYPDVKGGPPRQALVRYLPDVIDGVVRGYYVLGTDVSAIKRAELALRESEERFLVTIDEASIGMALVAPDGRFLRVNHALCALVGYSAEELNGLSLHTITHPDDLDSEHAQLARLARGDIARYQLRKRYVRKDGAIVDVMFNASALHDGSGAPFQFIAQIEDITEREEKRADCEQRLLAAIGPMFAASLDFEETLARIAELVASELADTCMIDVIETDDEPRALRAVGRDPALVAICERLEKMPHDRSRPCVLRCVYETRRPVLVQHPTPAQLGPLAPTAHQLEELHAARIQSMILVPLLVHDRLIGGIALISSTPTRIYGYADVRLAEELAHRAALSIDNARLYRAAKRATQAREDMLGVVAHDLRSPLSNILLQTALLQTGPSEQRVARAIQGIEQSVSRMQRLIEDLLDVARIDAGQLSVDIGRFDVRQLLADSIEPQRALARAAQLDLAVEVHEDHDALEICCDRDRLTQIFDNLIGNAIKFTEPGGAIRVSAVKRGGEMLFLVSDTGRGVSPGALPRLFDRFWQADLQDRRHGAGLGLAIVKGLVEAQGGRIWAESTPGKGTTFYFTIPLAAPVERSVVATTG